MPSDRRPQRTVLLVALAATVLSLWLAARWSLRFYVLTDFSIEAMPATDALRTGDVGLFLQRLPAYGGALMLETPATVLSSLLAEDARTGTFRALALPGLLGLGGLATWSGVLVGRTRGHLAAALTSAVACAAPIVALAEVGGHAEEVLTTVLAVSSVLAAQRGRWVLAGALGGLAAAGKPWAVVALVAVLAAAHGKDLLRSAAAAAVFGSLLLAPMLIAQHDAPHGGAVAGVSAASGGIFRPSSVFWFAGRPNPRWDEVRRSAEGRVFETDPTRESYAQRVEPPLVGRVTHPLVVLAGIALALLYRRRRAPGQRAGRDLLLLLAAVCWWRCLLDTWNIPYYALAAVVSLAVWEALGRRPPLLAAGLQLLVLVAFRPFLHPWTPDVQAAVYLALGIPAGLALAARAVTPGLGVEAAHQLGDRIAALAPTLGVLLGAGMPGRSSAEDAAGTFTALDEGPLSGGSGEVLRRPRRWTAPMVPISHSQRRADEAGFGLVEVLVSATLLVISMLALYSVLETQTEASATNRDSSTASSLAEADQERLRSFRVTDLADRDETRDVTVAGIAYEVSSVVDWIRDSTGGTQGCANASGQADYLRLTSTVTGGYIERPVAIRSLIAAPLGEFSQKQGTIAVSAKNAAGEPLQGVGVTASGPEALSDSTNAEGCAVFNYVNSGTYSVKVNAPGTIDTSGASPASASITASPGAVSAIDVAVDKPAVRTVSFITKLRDSSADTTAAIGSLSAANARVPGCVSTDPNCAAPTPGVRLFKASPSGSVVTSLTASNLFPFTDAYAFYAGSCAANSPGRYVSGYYAAAGHQNSQLLAPGTSGTIQIRVPALNLKLKKTNGTKWHVIAKPADTGCTESYTYPEITATAAEIQVQRGLPFGRWLVCVDDGTNRRTLNADKSVLLNADVMTSETSFDFTGSAPAEQTAEAGKCVA